MIRTVDDMYTRFLYGIDKEGTTTVYPEKFNELINESQGLIVNEVADEVQVNRRRMDDLSPITRRYSNQIVVTPPAGDPVTTYPKALPLDYFRELNIQFSLEIAAVAPTIRVKTVNNKQVSVDYFWGIPMRADNKAIALKNPYRNVSALFEDGNVYYEVMNNRIDTVGYDYLEYKMDYLIVPPAIYFDPNGVSHIHCILSPRMQQIITDRAIRIFIERTENPRYQTALNEDRIKNF